MSFHRGPEFNDLEIGVPLELGYGLSVTKISENLAAINSYSRSINEKTEGPSSKTIIKDKSEIKINSDNKIKPVDKSVGTIDKSKSKPVTKTVTRTGGGKFWIILGLVLVGVGLAVIVFKKLLNPF
jgi:hypothetical protein